MSCGCVNVTTFAGRPVRPLTVTSTVTDWPPSERRAGPWPGATARLTLSSALIATETDCPWGDVCHSRPQPISVYWWPVGPTHGATVPMHAQLSAGDIPTSRP